MIPLSKKKRFHCADRECGLCDNSPICYELMDLENKIDSVQGKLWWMQGLLGCTGIALLITVARLLMALR